MEEHKRTTGNGFESLSKRDKRRQQVASRLSKIEQTFNSERDSYYRESLHELQSTLAALQQGTSEQYVEKKTQLEETRDYELTKLRLWEEYQVKRIDAEYREDIEKAKETHHRMIKLIKEKLYDKLSKQIKQLKEDKLLLNLVNANSWNNAKDDSATAALNAAAAGSPGLRIHDRRSLRKREMSSRFTTGEADDLSDGGIGAGSTTAGNTSSVANGYVSASKRRRHYATRYSSNDESSGIASGMGHRSNVPVGFSSGNDSNLSDKDYDALNTLIMDNDDAGPSLVLLDKASKPNTRGSHKQFVGPTGLKPEELNEDLALLKMAVGK